MIRSELIQKIADENPHLTQRHVERIVNTVFEEIIEALAKGDRVELRGFGAFSVKARDARVGRNPRTGEAVKVDDKKVEALTSEINALNAKIYAEQVKMHKQMAKEGIVPMGGKGMMDGKGCPMMGGKGMGGGMGMMGGMQHGAGNGTAGQAPMDHNAHTPAKQ